MEIVAIIWCGKIIVPFEEYIPLIRPEYNCMPGKFESLVWDLNMNKLKAVFSPGGLRVPVHAKGSIVFTQFSCN